MEIRNLNTFLQVAALHNFTRAARELGYSQSNVSAQILQLEQEIGAPLFNRSGRQVSLTQFGEALLPYARELCSTAAKLQNMCRSEAFLRGTVRLGMTDSLSELCLEAALVAYHRRFPHVRLEIVQDTSAMLLERLRVGQLDAACLITDPLPGTEWLICDEITVPIVVVANAALPVCSKPSVTPEDIACQELVLTESLASYSMAFEQLLALHHLPCAPVIRLESTAAAARLVTQAPFVSVLPLYTVKNAADRGELCILPVPQWQHRQRVQSVLHRGRAMTPQIEGLLEELAAVLHGILSDRT